MKATVGAAQRAPSPWKKIMRSWRLWRMMVHLDKMLDHMGSLELDDPADMTLLIAMNDLSRALEDVL